MRSGTAELVIQQFAEKHKLEVSQVLELAIEDWSARKLAAKFEGVECADGLEEWLGASDNSAVLRDFLTHGQDMQRVADLLIVGHRLSMKAYKVLPHIEKGWSNE